MLVFFCVFEEKIPKDSEKKDKNKTEIEKKEPFKYLRKGTLSSDDFLE